MRKSEVKKHFGSLAEAARVLDISRAAVHQWSETVPEGSAYKLQVITGGRLKVRPTMYKNQRGTRRPKVIAQPVAP
jgi:hypothetical protein